MIDSDTKKSRVKVIILAYPLALLVISVILNLFAFGVRPAIVALPSSEAVLALAIAAMLLLLNHTWLMTTTELTRLQYGLHATPEEWESSENSKENVTQKGWEELKRRHNAHRNATENTIHFALLAVSMIMISPTTIAAQVWLIIFAISRLGHSYSYINGNDGLRGLFMSFGLIATYGLASYIVIGLVI
ncbi:MAPEG family protein [Sphingorhabdus sp. Alg239-R122]|uniref:MAPEG family protein n=1 Tax=Sphingorhabdus sp. Alg239-R122 TaxID=2305989 RepID=UPI0013D8F94C|nr:MAPEG family protein [Sphingorhabdus sp. Alg239-R122]